MFSKLGTKLALRKAGLPTDTLSSFDTSSKDPNASPFPNPFANIKIEVPKALISWQTPAKPPVEIATAPVIGGRAPTCNKLRLPEEGQRPCIIVFLRHCGCPFAEKTFLEMRRLANKYPNIKFIAVSHCSPKTTERWLGQIGGAWSVNIVTDEEREVYAVWGLGISTGYYLLNPWTQMAVRKLGNEEGIWAREVGEGGNRWVIGGAWGVDSMGTIRCGGASKTADDIPNLVAACEAIGAR